MRPRSFQNRVTTGRFTLPVVVVISMACWLAGGLLLPEESLSRQAGSALWQATGVGGWPLWILLAAGFLLHGVAGWLLIELNNAYAIIRVRASVQTSVYLLLVAACPPLYGLCADSVAVVCCLLALFFLFGSYQKRQSAGFLFKAFLFLGLGSLVVPWLTWLAPLFWAGAYQFRSLQGKSFVASLLGWALPYWFLLGHAYFYGQMELFCRPFREMVDFAPLHFDFRPDEWFALGYLFVLYAVSSGHCLVAGYEDKIRTRSYLHFFMLWCFCLFAFIGLQPDRGVEVLPLLLAGIGVLFGHFFALTSSRASNLFSMAAVVVLCLLFGLNLWMLC